jgi:hypothetical protein
MARGELSDIKGSTYLMTQSRIDLMSHWLLILVNHWLRSLYLINDVGGCYWAERFS